ncbi:hypothetical protein HI914_04145 [Erysiphe necator]|uniref:Putative acetyl-coenzyme a transporter 1 n=1 Tax=Uncinula necator TaxID=52586 RepID=A0A0B1P983_UNCNE|nr:hypothetical protein HI914_04145 [Erysiphe necator]KHJ35247.1 putative acetyl-coenzyme a transporter 1 [Erysiphe necator]
MYPSFSKFLSVRANNNSDSEPATYQQELQEIRLSHDSGRNIDLEDGLLSQTESSSEDLNEQSPSMGAKSHRKRSQGPRRRSGYERDTGNHNNSFNLSTSPIGSEYFSDDEFIPKKSTGSSKSSPQLPLDEKRNVVLLVILYFLQGIPIGLATGSVPFLLKPHMSYSALGVFSLASYPYSLKLLWSPIVDACWSPKIGRRKSWILPIQLLSGIGMIWLGTQVKDMMRKAEEDNGAGIWEFTFWWFFLVFMCATQDIAVDGWALTLLTPGNISYASTAQTVGLTAGQFMSYTVFLAFESPDFANRWFRKQPSDEGLMTLSGYLQFWGWIYIIVTIGLAIFRKEEKTKNEDGIWDVYKVMWGVLKLKNIQTIIIVHLIAKIGFQANDSVTNLKLIDKGFSQEDMALTVLIDFPFEIGLGYYAGKWSTIYTPMRLWCWGFVGRLMAAVIAQIIVALFPSNGVGIGYLLLVIAEHIFSTFTNTVMFVAISAFHAKIADPTIGGTYMTLLATVSNLGGTFPRFFVLKLVDLFTKATCVPAPLSSSPSFTLPDSLRGPIVTSSFACSLTADKDRCIQGAGTCIVERDGYYIVNIMCVLIGILTFWGFIKTAVMRLQKLPLRAWRVCSEN